MVKRRETIYPKGCHTQFLLIAAAFLIGLAFGFSAHSQTVIFPAGDDLAVGFGSDTDFRAFFESSTGDWVIIDADDNEMLRLEDMSTTGRLTVGAMLGFDVESLSTSGAIGTAPLSDGASGLTMTDVLTEIELDTESELEAQLTDASNVIVSTEIDSEAELEALLADVSNLIQSTEIDTEAELEAILTDVTNLIQESEIDTLAKIEAIAGAINIIQSTEIDTEAELEALLTDVTNLIQSTEIDTEAELEALLTDVSDLVTATELATGFTINDDAEIELGTGGDFGWVYDSGTGFLDLHDAGTNNLLTVEDLGTAARVTVEGTSHLKTEGILTVGDSTLIDAVAGVYQGLALFSAAADGSGFVFQNRGQGSDQKLWSMQNTGLTLALKTLSDALAPGANAILITRGTGTAVDTIDLTADTDVTITTPTINLTASTAVVASSGVVNVGADDSTASVIRAYGDSTTGAGRVLIYNGGTQDSNTEYYDLTADTDGDMVFKDSGGTVLATIGDSDDVWNFPQDKVTYGTDTGAVMTQRLYEVTVDYNDTFPLALVNVDDGYVVVDVYAEIVTTFDGTSVLDIGDGSTATGFLQLDSTDTASTGYYGLALDERGSYLYDSGGGHALRHVYTTTDTIDINLSSGTPTQGQVVVYVVAQKLK